MRRALRLTAWCCASCCALLLCGAPVAFATDLPAEIARAMKKQKIREDSVSLWVQAVDEDVPRLILNGDQPRNPASVIKLVTTWAALDLFGPTHTWRTRAYAMGPVVDGVLQGDLLIKGYGDPYLLTEDLWHMLGELRRTGLERIEGDLLLDDSWFDVDETDPAAFDGDGFRLYNVLPSALMVNFKSIRFELLADTATGRVDVRTWPELPNLTVTSQVKLTTGACRGNAPKVFMRYADPDNRDHVVFSGEMPASCRRYAIDRSAMTAQSYFYGMFRTLWQHWGGTITGGWRHATLTGRKQPLVRWRSRHLGEIVRPLNKWSNNLMTRTLLYAIAETEHKPPLTRAQGAEVIGKHLASRGLDTSALNIDNGSGLSRDTRVTAAMLGGLLHLAWRQPTMPEFVASLAIAGKDGTMRKRFRGKAGSGRMHVKTGSLKNVAGVAGYVHTTGGKTFAVVVLTNQAGVNYGPGRALQDAVLTWALDQ